MNYAELQSKFLELELQNEYRKALNDEYVHLMDKSKLSIDYQNDFLYDYVHEIDELNEQLSNGDEY